MFAAVTHRRNGQKKVYDGYGLYDMSGNVWVNGFGIITE